MPQAAAVEVVTIPQLVEQAARADPGATAIVASSRDPLSYEALQGLIGSVAVLLADRGIGPGDCLALVVGNGAEAATAFLSLASAAACAPLNPSYRREELDFYLDDLKPRAVVVSADLDSPVREAAGGREIPVLELDAVVDSPAGVFTLAGGLPAPAGMPARRPEDPALYLHTSGTTSRPKLVPLSQRNLAVSAASVAGTLGLQPDDRCLNLMPLFHIHGLVAVLLGSIRAGGSVACTPGFHAIRAFDWIEELRPTWLTAVPTMHQALLARSADRADTIGGHRLRFIRSSSAALPVPVLEQLEQVFGVPVIEAYGMTEAAHQMASNPLPPGRRRPGTVGPAAGPEITILSPDGARLPAGSVGEVAIRGENVFAGYQANPEANAAAFVEGWFRTGDEGRLDDQGYLTLTGRIKELINRGGEKIAPLEVDERLLSHPAVAEAVTFAIPDARLGEEVAAAVVLADGQSTDARDLQDFAAQTLAPFKVPRSIFVVAEIPKGPTGKIQRIGLADRLGVAGPQEAPVEQAEARTAFERLIAAIWAEVLGIPSIGVNDDFFSLGGDSILGAEAVARMRELMGRSEIPLVSIVRAPTVAAMSRELDGDVSALARSGPIALHPEAEGKPFFFVHGGDGEVLGFVALARAVGRGCSFYGLRSRGIDDGEAPHDGIEEMASTYVDRVRKLQPHGPYSIGGLCVGATVAIEMARRLEAAGESVSLVLVDPRPRRPKDPSYLLWLVGRRARERQLTGAVLRRLRPSRRPPVRGPQPSAIELEIAAMRRAHRPKRSLAPTVAIFGDEHEQYGIPIWHIRRIVPNMRVVRIHAPHEPILRPPHVEQVAREIRVALGLDEERA